jgi:hypothetical protein
VTDPAPSPAFPRCACGAEPIAVAPGHDGAFTDILGTRIYTQRPTADRAWCEQHWPWLARERAEA